MVIDSFKESDDIIRISGLIIVNRESQKHILIGEGASKVKSIGTGARIELERFFDKKVFLELYVKVDKDWRTIEAKLKKYGYIK